MQRLLHPRRPAADLSSLSKAKSNIAFRSRCAETAEDSCDVIGSDAALHLPSRIRVWAAEGRTARPEQFRCFWMCRRRSSCRRPAWTATSPSPMSFRQPRPLTWGPPTAQQADSTALLAAR